MLLLKKLTIALILPPVAPLIMIAVGFIVATRSNKRKLSGIILTLSGLSILLLFSMPPISQALVNSLCIHNPISPEEADRLPGKVQAIVVLSGGAYDSAPEYGSGTIYPSALARLRYGAWLHKRTRIPVLLTGGAADGCKPEAEIMHQIMREDYGIQARWIETKSTNTHENALMSSSILKKAGITSIALVTDAKHMRRSMLEFSGTGLSAVAAPTGQNTSNAARPLHYYLPSHEAFNTSCTVLKEWLGIAAYRIKGLCHKYIALYPNKR